MTIQEIKNAVKTALDTGKYLSVTDKVEKTATGSLLTYTVFYMTYESSFVAYTKFSFMLNEERTELVERKIVILRDLNCNYKVVDFVDGDALVNVIRHLMKNGYDKGDIRELSNVIVAGTDPFNDELKKDGIDNFIYSVEIVPTLISACPDLVLHMKITDNSDEKSLNVSKLQDKWRISINGVNHDIASLEEIYTLVAGTYK